MTAVNPPSQEVVTGPRLPNFVYIGPSKAGSTWLHEVLIRHPQIFMTDAKDLYFFDRYYDRGIEWYASHFRQARPEHLIVGEVCQEYLSDHDAPARIKEVLGPDTKLMVTLRDPVARAFSGYLYMRKHNVFSGTFREALETRPGMFRHSSYATLLNRYHEFFEPSQLYYGVFDDLVESPQAFIDGVLEWLGVEPLTLDDSLLSARLPASRARSKHVAGAVKAGANWAREHRFAALIGRVKRSTAVQRVLYVPLREKETVSEEDAAYMRSRLMPEIVALEDMVGIDLRARWGWPS